MKKKIYVGCALTQAPQEFRDQVEGLKNELRQEFEVLDFLGLLEGSPADVYRHDIYECVAKCDLFLAICDLPSLGLGWEIGAATLRFKKPVLAVVNEQTTLTRMAIGCFEEGYELVRYKEMGEVVNLVRERLT